MNQLKNLLVAALLGFASIVGNAGALTDYAENKIVDALLRGQTLGAPATWYLGLDTVSCTETGGGTEVTGGNYARQAVTASLANWAGTQGAGTTVASSGTGGTTSNNAAINWPTTTWSGTVVSVRLWDAASAGNAWVCTPLGSNKTVNTGDGLGFSSGSMTLQIDN